MSSSKVGERASVRSRTSCARTVLLLVLFFVVPAEAAKHRKTPPLPPLKLEHIRGEVRLMSPRGARLMGEAPLPAGNRVFVGKDASVMLNGAGFNAEILAGSSLRAVSPSEIELLSGSVRVKWDARSRVRQISTGITGFVIFAEPREPADLLLRVTHEADSSQPREVSLLIRKGGAQLQRISRDTHKPEPFVLTAGDEYTHAAKIGGPFAPRRVQANEIGALYNQLGLSTAE